MQPIILLTLLFASAFVSALPTTKRDAVAVLAAISQISSDVSDLNTAVSNYTGADGDNEPLLIGFENLKSHIECATSDIASSGTFSSDDSSTISNTLQDLTPHIINVLVDLMSQVNPSYLQHFMK
jgi:hypothetical protein